MPVILKLLIVQGGVFGVDFLEPDMAVGTVE